MKHFFSYIILILIALALNSCEGKSSGDNQESQLRRESDSTTQENSRDLNEIDKSTQSLEQEINEIEAELDSIES